MLFLPKVEQHCFDSAVIITLTASSSEGSLILYHTVQYILIIWLEWAPRRPNGALELNKILRFAPLFRDAPNFMGFFSMAHSHPSTRSHWNPSSQTNRHYYRLLLCRGSERLTALEINGRKAFFFQYDLSCYTFLQIRKRRGPTRGNNLISNCRF